MKNYPACKELNKEPHLDPLSVLQNNAYWVLTPLKYHVFENIMENGAFAPLEQMLHFP